MKLNPFGGRQRGDAEVIRESLARPQAFEVIFERHFDAIFGYLARRAGPGVADDLAAATFVVAFERRDAFRDQATSARPWLFGIATNVMRNEQRSARRTARLASRVASENERRQLTDSEPDVDIASLLVVLDEEQRDVVLLYAWEGLSYREIAVALGVPVGTVRSRLARARARLRIGLDSSTSVAPTRSERQEVTE